jgi:peptidylprolyl isomerase
MLTDGQTAQVRYRATLDDGSVFASTEDREPFAFRIGDGKIIPGLENAVRDIGIGETKTVRIACTDAFGEARDDLIALIPRERFPASIEPQQGKVLQMQTTEGDTIEAEIVEVSGEAVKIDANHPLAGQDLTFEVTLLEIA